MSLINLSLPTGESPCNGKHISFSAPCSCEGVTGVKIGDTTYSLVNSAGLDYVSNGGRWVSGAYMTVMLDVTNSKAYVVTEHIDSNITSITTTTLFASNWDSITKTYSFETDYPKATYDLEIALDSTATSEQAEAFNGAQIVGSATSNIVKAYGTVPTVDIPIIIKVVTK